MQRRRFFKPLVFLSKRPLRRAVGQPGAAPSLTPGRPALGCSLKLLLAKAIRRGRHCRKIRRRRAQGSLRTSSTNMIDDGLDRRAAFGDVGVMVAPARWTAFADLIPTVPSGICSAETNRAIIPATPSAASMPAIAAGRRAMGAGSSVDVTFSSRDYWLSRDRDDLRCNPVQISLRRSTPDQLMVTTAMEDFAQT